LLVGIVRRLPLRSAATGAVVMAGATVIVAVIMIVGVSTIVIMRMDVVAESHGVPQ
jgi:hypothetical protein